MSPGLLLSSAALGRLAAAMASRRAPRLWLVTTAGSAAATLAGAGSVLASGQPWEWRGGALGGDGIQLRVDVLSAFFLLLVAALDLGGALYGDEYWTEQRHPRSAPDGRMWWTGLVSGLSLVLVAAHGLAFLAGWECFAVSAAFLVALERMNPQARRAAILYLNCSHAATLALFALFAVLATRTGTWNLGPVQDRAELAPLFWLALFAFGLKAGAFPLHIWLPSAHANAPSHVSALLSGCTIKIGIYGLLRFSGWLPLPAGAGLAVVILGAASAVLGVAFALGQHDLKRLLAYHSVENIGIILLGVGFALLARQRGTPAALWGQLALTGALLHVWNHGLFKSLLFLGAGSVLHATGGREMSRLGGLWRVLPWTTGLFGVGAIAIAGLPPLNGFVSEWLIYLGLFDSANARDSAAPLAITATILLAMTGALALACFVKVCGITFLGAPRAAWHRTPHEASWRMRGPMLALAVGCGFIGTLPTVVWPLIAAIPPRWDVARTNLPTPDALRVLGLCQIVLLLGFTAAGLLFWRLARRRASAAPTWDCGYAVPTSRMQYTAGSFAATIVEWFRWALRTERHVGALAGPFPSPVQFSQHTPEAVLDRLVLPSGGLVLRAATLVRRLQHGHVQAYLLYVLIGTAVLAGLVMSGGPQ